MRCVILIPTTRKGNKMNKNFFAKAELQNFKTALKMQFPNATFKAKSIGTAPNGKPAWEVTGYGEVLLSDMEALENKMAFSHAFIVTEANSYQLI